ncbi:2,3-bisphosphoglycerate-dependent phosphoglycerate mutase [Anaerolineae bacterium]|nr:2,3-bisphosphoglycerate-dependent phosphoglycerate mutase [Anaerolineae bacterium]
MSPLYLVRHAHADWSPDENRSLSAQGLEASNRVAEILRSYPIRAIYSSPAQRARQTVASLATRLGLAVRIEPDLQERELGKGPFEDFFKAVKVTWQDPQFAHPGGESNVAAQHRGLAVVRRLLGQHPTEQIVFSTHGNLLALILQAFDPAVDFAFWKSLTMPDIFSLTWNQSGNVAIRRLWQETEPGVEP